MIERIQLMLGVELPSSLKDHFHTTMFPPHPSSLVSKQYSLLSLLLIRSHSWSPASTFHLTRKPETSVTTSSLRPLELPSLLATLMPSTPLGVAVTVTPEGISF
ncbi:hypothetical protein TNCT_115621 [Trichonephila clavata]|uniref:Uncharacterized protein n=1 Tax=Trichonephila clavata TaxID=2740835 RepID=A0A8X6LMT4_TRICU|nr:hypothetical protein TNCT_115621 [Trichonephila clavata]